MTGDKWRSFWMGTFVAVLIAVVAGVIMSNTNSAIGEKFSSSSTRLD